MLFRSDSERVEMQDLESLKKTKIKDFGPGINRPNLRVTEDEQNLIISTKQ